MRIYAPVLLLALSACTADDAPFVVSEPSADPLVPSVVPLSTGPAAGAHSASRVVVGFGADVPAARLRVSGKAMSAGFLHNRLGIGVYDVPAGSSVADVVAELQATGRYAFVEPDYAVRITGDGEPVNDPYRDFQWNLDQVDAESAWRHSMGEGVLVAVLDTGVSPNGPDGISAIVEGFDFVNDDPDPADDNGHGTHVAGTIAQATDNGVGVAGLAPGASVLPVKVLDGEGSGWTSTLIEGIAFAVDNGADVINMSLGSSSSSDSLRTAIDDAVAAGVLVVAATGNDDADQVGYPAAYPGVLAVGAIDAAAQRASYSNYGAEIDLVAPGGDNSVDHNGDGLKDGILQETVIGGSFNYFLYQGTSMASPHVAAAGALLIGAGASAEEAADLLTSTAMDSDIDGWDERTGWGAVQPAAALDAWMEREEEAEEPSDDTPGGQRPGRDAPVDNPFPDPDFDGPDVGQPTDEPGDEPDDGNGPSEPGVGDDPTDSPTIDPDPGAGDPGRDAETDDGTPPVISRVRVKSGGSIAFDTDELTYGEACTIDYDQCWTAMEGYSTTHTVYVPEGYDQVLLIAEDQWGNTEVVGPYNSPS